MGTEFLQRAGKTIALARDKDRVRLCEATLFTRLLELPRRFEVMVMEPGVMVSEGDEVYLEKMGAEVVVMRGENLIGRIARALPGVVALLKEFGAVAGDAARHRGQARCDGRGI